MESLILFLLLIIIAISIFLGLWVLLADKRSRINQTFFAVVVTILAWNIFGFLANNTMDNEVSLMFYRINYGVVALFFISFYYFTIFFPVSSKNRSLLSEYFVVLLGLVLFTMATFTDLVAEKAIVVDATKIIVHEGSFANLFYAFALLLTIITLYTLIKKYVALDKINRIKISYFLIGTFVFATFNVLFNIFGFFIIKGNTKYTQLGDFSAIFFLCFAAYAIMKHQLFNIKVIATEATVIILSLALFVEIFISNSLNEGLIKSLIWIVATYGGYQLIKSVKIEIQQKSDLEKLTEKLEDSNKQLEVANKELEDLDKMKDEFISVASHELNTPLAAIEGYLSMILDEKMAKVDPKAKEYLKRAYQSSKRLAALITDLLNVSRIEQGRIHLQYELADMPKEIEEAVNELKIKADQKKIELEYEKSKEKIPETWFDSGRIHEVLVNLIGNAIKFTDKGGVYVSAKKTDDGVQVSVRDTGIGIAKENAERLFHKFSQINRAQEERQGTGLGLYISKNYVELHNGKIWAESEGEGKGTTISFLLPILKEKPFDPHEGEGAVLRSKPSEEVLNQVIEISKQHAIKE